MCIRDSRLLDVEVRLDWLLIRLWASVVPAESGEQLSVSLRVVGRGIWRPVIAPLLVPLAVPLRHLLTEVLGQVRIEELDIHFECVAACIETSSATWFSSGPAVPAVLGFIQQQAKLDDHEAYGTLNMGAGFALYVAAADAERTVEVARGLGVEAMVAGRAG